MDWFPVVVAVVAVVAALALIVKGWDVRLVLFAAALAIACSADLATALSAAGAAAAEALALAGARPVSPGGAVSMVVRQFLATFSNEKFVVPICAAMGFAYVLKHTGCERHLVLLLVRPLRYVRAMLVPGVVVVGFLVNIPLVSQTSTAVCIGAVVVPLMRAAGYSMGTIGACLLLGASVGGELLNPGAPELLTVFTYTKVNTTEIATKYLPPLVFTQLAIATAVIWVMSVWWERNAVREEDPTPQPPPPGGEGEKEAISGLGTAPTSSEGSSPPLPLGEGVGGWGPPAEPRINLLKALVPLVPLALLFATSLPGGYKLFDVPDKWVMALKPDGTRDAAYSTRLIGLAMLIGVLIAALVTPSRARDCVKEFFSGAGYGFTNVVSLIVIATCFGAAIESAGLARLLGQLIQEAPNLLHPLAAFVPLSFAAVSGSGMASTQSLYGFFYYPAVDLEMHPVSVGAMVSLGSGAGRTMSPVAAVTLMCATLTGTNPFTLAKRVAVPLLTGIVVVVLLRLANVL
jgi:DcuC family C4-dicarboxylate transporter